MAWTMPDDREEVGYLALWDAVAAAVPDRECIVQGARRQDWHSTQARTVRLGWWLTVTGAGARPGEIAAWQSPNDTVGVLLRNCPEHLETVIACYRARCAPFNVNYRYTADEIAHLIDDAAPSVLVLAREFGPVVEAAIAASTRPSPALLVVEDGSGAQLPAGAVEYESALASAVEPATIPAPSADDVHILYTGGTTGLPKGVLWRQADVVAAAGISVRSADEAAQAAPRRSWLRAFPAPPLMHGASLWFAYNAWARGATIVLDPEPASFDADRALAIMREERVTWLAVVGDAFVAPLVAAIDRCGAAPPDLTYVFSSGAVLGERSWAALTRYYPQLSVINALGSSETGPQAFQTSAVDSGFRPGPDTVVVSDDHARILDASTPGEGWLANGGTLPRGYLGDPERTTATFRTVAGRRLSISGDRAVIDADGTIRFLGRAANVINTGGEKVHAEEVERALLRCPAVGDVLVVGRPSERWGQEVVAIVVADPATTDGRLRAHCAQGLAGYKVPKEFLRVPEIHRAPNGKADYDWARSVVAPATEREETSCR